MSPLDVPPRTPVLVGGAQRTQREDDPRTALEPLALMEAVARAAAEDAGAPGLLAAADAIRVPRGLWRYPNPAHALGERFGAARPRTALGPLSGNTVQRLLSDAALGIVRGERDVVLVVGAEAERSKRRAKAQGVKLAWGQPPAPAPDESFEIHHPMWGQAEAEARLVSPPVVYALFETALRHAAGRSVAAHRERIAALWSAFSAVAAANPHAWTREPRSPAELATPSAANPWIAPPYTKFLCSNMVVDQAAALILCSAEAAARHGVPRERWIFPQAATDAQAVPVLSHREDFASSPAVRLGGRRACALAGLEPAEIEHVDLYSCFPSAVQIAAAELGLSLERPLTVTGGLGFAGGPLNSYVLHATAAMLERLRAEPGSRGLVTSVGGWLSKHAFAVYAGEPRAGGFAHADLDAELERLPTRELAGDAEGEARVEAYAVHAVDGVPVGLSAACRLPDGRRAWARSEDPELAATAVEEELCGRAARIEGGLLAAVGGGAA